MKQQLAVLAHDLLRAHAKQPLGRKIRINCVKRFVVNEQDLGKVIDDRFQDFRPSSSRGNMRHQLPLSNLYTLTYVIAPAL
jgi:hypothetical protein